MCIVFKTVSFFIGDFAGAVLWPNENLVAMLLSNLCNAQRPCWAGWWSFDDNKNNNNRSNSNHSHFVILISDSIEAGNIFYRLSLPVILLVAVDEDDVVVVAVFCQLSSSFLVCRSPLNSVVLRDAMIINCQCNCCSSITSLQIVSQQATDCVRVSVCVTRFLPSFFFFIFFFYHLYYNFILRRVVAFERQALGFGCLCLPRHINRQDSWRHFIHIHN